MAKQTINIGQAANDGSGDPLRNAFDKVNDNFTELYDSVDVQDLDFQGDTGTGSVELDSQVLDIAGGTGIDTVASGQSLTVNIDTTVATLTGTQTLTNKTVDADNNTISNLEVDNLKAGVLDTDLNAVSTLDDTVASAKAIKTYVDAQVTAQDLDFIGDTGTGAVDLDSQSLSVTGGTGIDTTASGQDVSIAIDSTVATLTGTQTLTNKTIDADNNTVSNLEVDNLKAGVLDTDLTTVSATDDTLASAKAIKTYVDANITAQDLDITDGTVTSAVDLDSQIMTIQGTTNEVEVGLIGQSFTVGLPDNVVIAGDLTVDTNTLYVDAANNRVGIGTSTPSSILTLNGTTGSDLQWKYNGQNYLRIEADANGGSYYAAANKYHRFLTSGTERMKIYGAGDISFRDTSNNEAFYWDASAASLGIGTTSINSKVQIEQAQQISGAFSNPFIKLSNSAQTNNTGTTAIALATSTADNYGYAISAKRGTTGADSDFIITHHDNSLTGTPRFVIDGSGNVGIGTDSPSDNLHISGTTASIILQDSDGIDTFGRIRYTGSSMYFMSRNNTANGNFIFTGNDGSTDTEFMRIKFNGNVGIGTNNPSTPLEVAGKVLLSGIGQTGTNNVFVIENDLGNTKYQVDSVAGDYRIQFKNAGNTIRVKLDSNGNSYLNGGNVGIGTTSPTRPLHINAGTNNDVATFESTDSSARISIQDNTAKTDLLHIGSNFRIDVDPFNVGASSIFILRIDSSEKMRITSSGNVGIGTTSPAYKLSVTATGTSAETVAGFGNGNIEGGLQIITSDGNLEWGFNALNSRSLVFQTNQTERMRITGGGDVLIGTTGEPDGTSNYGSAFTSETSNTMMLKLATSTTGAKNLATFYNPNGAVGKIQVNGSATSYITSSDYRLKENVVEMTGALDRVDALKPSRFNFIADPTKTVDGFLAHEVADVVPEAITGEKDAVDEDGNAVYQGIDQSKLVPLLVGAIQELKAEIETLKSQINK